MNFTQAFSSVGIIGYGRFGRLLHQILSEALPEVDLRLHSRSRQGEDGFVTLEAAAAADLVIPTVPISSFEETVSQITPMLRRGAVLMDVCSVKLFPKEVLTAALPAEVHIVCSHPMFGPAGYRKRGSSLQGMTVVAENVRCDSDKFEAIAGFFTSLGLRVELMDADSHDRLAARIQFVTLSAASFLRELELTRSKIDTPSATAMMDFLEMVSVDRELVRDLYRFNPYCQEQFDQLERSFERYRRFITK